MTMFRVVLPYACFGGLLDERNRVIAVAPIGFWMRNKHLTLIKEWAKLNKYEFTTWEVAVGPL